MDDFAVLVESIGFRGNGKSAPLAKMKPKSGSVHASRAAPDKASKIDSFSVNELDGIFRSNHGTVKTQEFSSFLPQGDVFGANISSSSQYRGVDLDNVFKGSSRPDYFTGTSSSKNSDSYGDLLGLGGDNDGDDDSFGNFQKSSFAKEDKSGNEDNLLSGFGGTEPAKTRVSLGSDLNGTSNIKPSHLPSTVNDDPFSVFESAGSVNKDGEKESINSSFDVFVDFGMGSTASISSSGASLNEFNSSSYFDDIFGAATKVMEPDKSVKTSSSNQINGNSLFDDFFHEEKKPQKAVASKPPFIAKKATATRNQTNDFSFLFGDISTSSEELNEINGEPEERRRARLNRHIRTNERMAEALAEKNKRDLLNQREQEEKRNLAETLDRDINRWAAGKEGNLRALLSALQEVLWPECGWRPVSLTDLITSDSVKKVYKKANLCVHPDKVQQKGANVQQKYIAEKVFDKLKEAWTKFSADELR